MQHPQHLEDLHRCAVHCRRAYRALQDAAGCAVLPPWHSALFRAIHIVRSVYQLSSYRLDHNSYVRLRRIHDAEFLSLISLEEPP